MNTINLKADKIKTRTKEYLFCCLIILFLLPPSLASYGQDSGQPQDDTASLATLKATVEASPDSLSYHKRFINAFRESIPSLNFHNYDSIISLLRPQYDQWMKQFPHSAIVPFAIGDAYGEGPEARLYLLEAVKRDPKLAAAWADLSDAAERWGNNKASREYMEKAAAISPDNPDYAFYYAFKFENTDPAKFKSLLYDLIKRFPKNERGAQALYWLAFDTYNVKDKIKIYEQLRTLYPPDKFDWSSSGMSSYFYLLLKTDPAKALSLAKEMNEKMTDEDSKAEWQKSVALAEKVNRANQLIASHQPAEALQTLSGTTVSHWTGALEALNLLKAKAMAANGNVQSAYDSLIVMYAQFPHIKTQEALLQYGKELNKDEKQVNADVWRQRETTAKQAHPFTLRNYLTEDSVSLSDFHGKPVLLTFWFPGCGPCRGEFPHFQKMVNEFKSKGEHIVFLGINVLPDQNEYVVPFMKGTGYTFMPLESNDTWAQKNYGVRGEPTNFLIDGKGKIIFTGFMIQDHYEEEMLKLMISSMLNRERL